MTFIPIIRSSSHAFVPMMTCESRKGEERKSECEEGGRSEEKEHTCCRRGTDPAKPTNQCRVNEKCAHESETKFSPNQLERQKCRTE